MDTGPIDNYDRFGFHYYDVGFHVFIGLASTSVKMGIKKCRV